MDAVGASLGRDIVLAAEEEGGFRISIKRTKQYIDGFNALNAQRATVVAALTIEQGAAAAAVATDAALLALDAEATAGGFASPQADAAAVSARRLVAALVAAEQVTSALRSASGRALARVGERCMRTAGVTATELKAVGYSAAALRPLGYTAGELEAAGFSAEELAAAGFGLAAEECCVRFRVFVLLMPTGETIEVDSRAPHTIGGLKRAIEEARGIPQYNQRLIYAGKLMEDARTLADYNIGYDARLQLKLAMRGD